MLASDFALLYPSRVRRLALLAAPPPRLFKANMDVAQFAASWYMWLFMLTPLAAAFVRSKDYRLIGAVFTKPKAGGCLTTPMDGQDVEHFKDAIARPGRLRAALTYYRRAQHAMV